MKFHSIKVVLDTNVWLSGLFWEGEASKIIELAEKKIIIPLVTEEILQEIADVLSKESKFQKFLEENKQNIEILLKKIISLSEIIEAKTKLNIIEKDPEDNIFLETALDGNARYIVSYDNHLRQIKEFKSIKIISPTEFLKIIKSSKS